MKYPYKSICALLLGILSTSVYALHLGEIRVASRIGEPLDAYVNVYARPDEVPSGIRLQVLPDPGYAASHSMTRLVERFEARVERGPADRLYIHIRSTGPVTEPVIAFRLKAFQGERALIRRYSLAPPPAERRTTAPAQRPAASVRSPAAIEIITGDEYGPVRSGDTLWGIAKRVGNTGGSDVAELVRTLFAANPQAFIDGDIDRLKIGVMLTIPGAERATSAPPETPETGVVPESAPSPMAEESMAVTSGPESAPASMVEESMTPMTEPETGIEPQAVRRTVDWRQRDPELAARLTSLTEKYASIKARYDSEQRVVETAAPFANSESDENVPRSGAPATGQATVKPGPATAEVSAPAPESDITVATAEEDVRLDTTGPERDTLARRADPQATPETDDAATSLRGGLSTSAYYLIASICVMLLLVVFVGMRIRAVSASRRRQAAINHRAAEQDRKAEVQRKAANRLRMEDEVKRIIDEKRSTDDNREFEIDTDLLETLDLMSTVELKSTIDLGTELPTEEAREQQNLIDANIAHGRYFEAEKLLKDVLVQTPLNHVAKLRLAEVYYITERVDDFMKIATDLHDNHRADIADADWQRVMRMGKVIAADEPLFAGPKGVERESDVS